MNFKDFKVLDKEVEGDSPEYLTTHPLITYDSIVDTYWVNLGMEAYCEVYGWNRAKRAFEIAEACHIKGEVSFKPETTPNY